MIKEIKFTDNALKQINNLLASKEEGSFFRIAIKGGGCSGFQYEFTFDKSKAEDDLNFENILITQDFLATQEFQENFDNNWNDNDPEDGHFDFIPVEYVYDVENNEVTSEIAIVTTKYRGKIRTHDPYDESEWESQN